MDIARRDLKSVSLHMARKSWERRAVQREEKEKLVAAVAKRRTLTDLVGGREVDQRLELEEATRGKDGAGEVILAHRCFRSLFKLALSFHCIKTRPYQQSSNAILQTEVATLQKILLRAGAHMIYIYIYIYKYIYIYI